MITATKVRGLLALFGLLSLVLGFFVMGSVRAAVAGVGIGTYLADDFNGYAAGASLNGRGGISGWDSTWTDYTGSGFSAGNFTATASGALEDRLSATASNGSSSHSIALKRELTSDASGDTISFKIKSDDGGDAAIGVLFQGDDAPLYSWSVNLKPTTGHIYLESPYNTQQLGTYSPDTIYTIDVQFDYANNRARLRVDGGSWSSWNTPPYQTNTKVEAMYLYVDDSGGNGPATTGWWDDIKMSNEEI